MRSRTAPVDFADVQGIVRFGYKHLTEACYLLLRVRDAAAARAWLLAAPISGAAEQNPPPPTATQVAFTARGLAALRVPAAVVAGFSNEFLAGMADENRARRLGDVGANAPATWRWGAGGAVPDLVVMAFARAGGLAAHEARLAAGGWSDAFELLARLDTSDLGGVEPFGFRDGISQPVPDWERARDAKGFQYAYGNRVALGEILLGYRNEYRKYTARPLVGAGGGAAQHLLPAEDEPAKRDVGRNGTYVVLRDLRQDVRAFWRFVEREAPASGLAPDELAAAMVGRTRAGRPLLPPQARSIPGAGMTPDEIGLNGFTYDGDPNGEQCPLGAHVRRANPRNADFPRRPPNLVAQAAALLGFGGDGGSGGGFRADAISSVRFHRVLRRGREYGPGLTPAEARAPAPPDDPERGLRFIAVNANILRQFEFLQNAWMRSTKFDGLSGESDPLLGNRAPIPGCPLTDGFSLPRAGGARRRIAGVPQFVTVRGGAYFFLPGLRALRYLAEVGT